MSAAAIHAGWPTVTALVKRSANELLRVPGAAIPGILSPVQRDAENKPKAVFRQRIIMPVEAFANTAELMKNVLAGLIKSGAVKMQPAPQAPAAAAEVPGRNVSPNFRGHS